MKDTTNTAKIIKFPEMYRGISMERLVETLSEDDKVFLQTFLLSHLPDCLVDRSDANVAKIKIAIQRGEMYQEAIHLYMQCRGIS